MKLWFSALFGMTLLISAVSASSQPANGSLDIHWNEGAKDCKANPQPPLQVHAYNPQTFILRENLCATFEAPFMYLLVGSSRALLIDTGDVANPEQMPLEKTVMGLLPGDGPAKLPLLVVHSHRHLDHRAGDGQFQGVPNVQVVGYDLDSVKRYYKFNDWPNGVAHIDLGNRIVDVIPPPGHNETHVVFYDGNTGLFFSGDFLMPGRLLIDDTDADLASAKRAVAFVHDRPVTEPEHGRIEAPEDVQQIALPAPDVKPIHVCGNCAGAFGRTWVLDDPIGEIGIVIEQQGQFLVHPYRREVSGARTL